MAAYFARSIRRVRQLWDQLAEEYATLALTDINADILANTPSNSARSAQHLVPACRANCSLVPPSKESLGVAWDCRVSSIAGGDLPGVAA
jgi:hypothetical protein